MIFDEIAIEAGAIALATINGLDWDDMSVLSQNYWLMRSRKSINAALASLRDRGLVEDVGPDQGSSEPPFTIIKRST